MENLKVVVWLGEASSSRPRPSSSIRTRPTRSLKNLTQRPSRYRVLFCFSLKIRNFSELCQLCCSAGVLPAWCVYRHCRRGKAEKGKSPEYFKIYEKNTIFNEHSVEKSFFLPDIFCSPVGRDRGDCVGSSNT